MRKAYLISSLVALFLHQYGNKFAPFVIYLNFSPLGIINEVNWLIGKLRVLSQHYQKTSLGNHVVLHWQERNRRVFQGDHRRSGLPMISNRLGLMLGKRVRKFSSTNA